MDKKSGYFILIGLLMRMLFGSSLGTANDSALLGLGMGALAGAFVGWFVAAATAQVEHDKKARKSNSHEE